MSMTTIFAHTLSMRAEMRRGLLYLFAAVSVLMMMVALPARAETQSNNAAEPMAGSEASGLFMSEMGLGAEDAPVVLEEYASFTCPHCARFHSDVLPEIKRDYIDAGLVKFLYHEVYFDGPGLWAAMLARCAPKERYFGIADLLYEKQSEWARGNSAAQIADNLRRIGRSIGMEDAQMEACMQDREAASELVAAYQERMKESGVTGTPSLIINGVNHGNQSLKDLRELLDQAISDAKEAGEV